MFAWKQENALVRFVISYDHINCVFDWSFGSRLTRAASHLLLGATCRWQLGCLGLPSDCFGFTLTTLHFGKGQDFQHMASGSEELEANQQKRHEPYHHEDSVPGQTHSCCPHASHHNAYSSECLLYTMPVGALLKHGLEAQLTSHVSELLGLLFDAVGLAASQSQISKWSQTQRKTRKITNSQMQMTSYQKKDVISLNPFVFFFEEQLVTWGSLDQALWICLWRGITVCVRMLFQRELQRTKGTCRALPVELLVQKKPNGFLAFQMQGSSLAPDRLKILATL